MPSRLRAIFWTAAALLGFLQIWAHRLDVNPDGISYIEMAWSGVLHGWSGFLNGYWSPLYPFLLSLGFRAARPGSTWEAPVVHLVNFAIYLAAAACFEYFLLELLRWRERSHAQSSRNGLAPLPPQVIWFWGAVFFLWASQLWLSPVLMSPDLAVAALAWLATALLLRIRRTGGGWFDYLFLGAVLGIGYLAKAFMLPMAGVFVVCALLASAVPLSRSLPRVVATGLVCMLIGLPYVLGLSRAKGRWTAGDAGALNYAVYVDPFPGLYALGGTAGVIAHPYRKLLDRPPLYEFGTPVKGSYPPAFDPSYWYTGVHPYFWLRGELRILAQSLGFSLQMFSRSGALYAAFLVLFLLLRRTGSWGGAGAHPWAVFLPSYAAIALYAIVRIDPRYVGGFVLMLLMTLLASVRPSKARIESYLPFVSVAMVLLAGGIVLWSAGRNVAAILSSRPSPQFQVARALETMNLASGDGYPDLTSDSQHRTCAATIGAGVGSYWAHLAGVRIIADTPDPAGFWRSDAGTQNVVMGKLAGAGVRFVVAEVPRPMYAMRGWQRVAATNFYIHPLTSTSVEGSRSIATCGD